MVIDTSAIIAILLREPDAPLFAEAIENGTPRLMSAATLLETSMVIETRKGEAGGQELDLFIYRAGVKKGSVKKGSEQNISDNRLFSGQPTNSAADF